MSRGGVELYVKKPLDKMNKWGLIFYHRIELVHYKKRGRKNAKDYSGS